MINRKFIWGNNFFFVQKKHVDFDSSYLCGYLKIKGLTEEYPTLTTFFDGEIISSKYPFLTRKWDADEEVRCAIVYLRPIFI